MAGSDFETALDRHLEWGIKTLDLKDAILGSAIANLTDAQAETAARMIRQRALSVHCFSTGLFHDAIERGEDVFRREHLAPLDRVLALAAILQPRFIRILAATTTRRKEIDDSIRYLEADHRWVIPLYAEAVDRIAAAGYQATIENETGGCLFSSPGEIRGFFDRLGRRRHVCLTWDVQNLWQAGVFPSMDVYATLKDLIGYYHLKGGQREAEDSALRWRSSLETASWPVAQITRQVIRDGVSPVLCLNPSHGAPKPGEPTADFTKQDLDFVRGLLAECAR